MKVVFVAPHPDDAEIFAGGVAIKHSMRGDELAEIIVTDGQLGALLKRNRRNLVPRRKKEARAGASILGISKLKFLGLADQGVELNEETREKIRKAVEAEKPELIYAPDPEFTIYPNPDHRVIGKIIEESFSDIPIRFCHTTKPNLEIDISDVLDRKMLAIKAHQTQWYIPLFSLPAVTRFRYMPRRKIEQFRVSK